MNMFESLKNKIKNYDHTDFRDLMKKYGEHLTVAFTRLEKHLEKYKNTYGLIGKLLYGTGVFFLKLIEVMLFIIVSFWNAITQSFFINLILSFLVIVVLLYALFKIAPHTGNISFTGYRENIYIDTTADNVYIYDGNITDDIIEDVAGEVYVYNCQIQDSDNIDDYEIIRLKGMYKYTAMDSKQLESYGITMDSSNDDGYYNGLVAGASTFTDTNLTIYELKNYFRDYFEVETYSDGEEYLNNIFLQGIESRALYSRILQEIQGYKSNKRDVRFKYFSPQEKCVIDSSNIFLFCPGFTVYPLTDTCQIEIIDANSTFGNEEVLNTIPIQEEFVISKSNNYTDENIDVATMYIRGSCGLRYQDTDPKIIIEGSKGMQAEVTGDFVFNYSNEPTEFDLHNRRLDIESRYGLLDIIIGYGEANRRSLSLNGEITRGYISGINLFPSFSSWYRNNVYLVPLTLISTIFTCATLMLSKKKTTSSWNPFEVDKENKKDDESKSQSPTIIINIMSQSPLEVSIDKDSSEKDNGNTSNSHSNEPEAYEDEYLDEHPECAD